MKPSNDIIEQDLVLIGGGHSHVAVLKSFGMNTIPGVRLTVIARDVHTPYSGMLPGYIAGHYTYDEAHIDLRPLCQFAGARLYHSEATAIDPVNKRVICEGRPPVSYDSLSINIGSRPRLQDVAGASEHATPVKPINRFVDRWHRLTERVLSQSGRHRICVIGAGAAGVEVLLAIQFRLKNMLRDAGRASEHVDCHLICRTERILPAFPPAVSGRFDRVLKERGVHVYRGVEASEIKQGDVHLSNGDVLQADEVLMVTGAGAPAWLGASGLDVDTDGFVTVNDCLQSTSHPDIFAAGDVAAMINHPREKAGVFAVRQGKPLTENLRRTLQGRELKPFTPQQSALALISTGDKYAVAARGRFSLAGERLWTWKDWIDRRWMAQYTELPQMTPQDDSGDATADTPYASDMRCGGCGAKVGADVLSRALHGLAVENRDDILVGLHEPDDAAVIDVPTEKVLVQTVDHFRAFIDDPYIFGKVAANHALSDIFAMGGTAHTALAITTVPFGPAQKVEDVIRHMMLGATEVLTDAGAALVGGHTGEGEELALGFAITGTADPSAIVRKTGMKPGDALVLTKPLGTGALFAANMQHKAKGRWIDGAIQSMLLSNHTAAECFIKHDVNACTDITGFGFIGHLTEMSNGMGVEIALDALPVLDGTIDCMERGIVSSLHAANRQGRDVVKNMDTVGGHARLEVMFDPQTAGGLLASIPAANAAACVQALSDQGYEHATIVGTVTEKTSTDDFVTIVV